MLSVLFRRLLFLLLFSFPFSTSCSLLSWVMSRVYLGVLAAERSWYTTKLRLLRKQQQWTTEYRQRLRHGEGCCYWSGSQLCCLQLLVLLQPLQLCSAYSHTCWLQASAEAAAKAELLLCHRRRPNKNPPTIFTLGKIMLELSSFFVERNHQLYMYLCSVFQIKNSFSLAMSLWIFDIE